MLLQFTHIPHTIRESHCFSRLEKQQHYYVPSDIGQLAVLSDRSVMRRSPQQQQQQPASGKISWIIQRGKLITTLVSVYCIRSCCCCYCHKIVLLLQQNQYLSWVLPSSLQQVCFITVPLTWKKNLKERERHWIRCGSYHLRKILVIVVWVAAKKNKNCWKAAAIIYPWASRFDHSMMRCKNKNWTSIWVFRLLENDWILFVCLPAASAWSSVEFRQLVFEELMVSPHQLHSSALLDRFSGDEHHHVLASILHLLHQLSGRRLQRLLHLLELGKLGPQQRVPLNRPCSPAATWLLELITIRPLQRVMMNCSWILHHHHLRVHTARLLLLLIIVAFTRPQLHFLYLLYRRKSQTALVGLDIRPPPTHDQY